MAEELLQYTINNGVVMISKPHKTFSDIYLKVTEKEGRLYSDKEVKQLPEIDSNHKYFKEWKFRKKSAERLVNYINKGKKVKKVMEIGCGNGWFSNYLAFNCDVQVCGLDINLPELEQAARVFEHPNVYFTYGDIFANAPFQRNLDLIVLNKVVEYFPDLEFLFERLAKFLRKGGEIHILDSPFFPPYEVYEEKIKTMQYYKSIGYPAMSVNHFHHSMKDIKNFEILYYGKSNKFFKLINWNDSPYMWLKWVKK